MPGLNRKGPEGAGPMTGRQQGLCTGNVSELPPRGWRNAGRGFRRGFGRGGGRLGGRGMGFRWGNPSAGYPDEATGISGESMLQNEVSYLKQQLSRVENALKQIREQKEEE